MIDLRPRAALGTTSNEWLEAEHHFSFAHYQHSGRNGWGDLISLNRNVLAPRAEMRPQPIDGTEIVTVVRRGVVAHTGSFGGKCRVATGEVELVSTGQGITHAFVNPGKLPAEYVEIRVASVGMGKPSRALARFPGRRQSGDLVLLASGFAEDRDAMVMHAEARILGARLPGGTLSRYRLGTGRHAYILACSGEIAINGIIVEPGSAAALVEESIVYIEVPKAAEFLMIDTR